MPVFLLGLAYEHTPNPLSHSATFFSGQNPHGVPLFKVIQSTEAVHTIHPCLCQEHSSLAEHVCPASRGKIRACQPVKKLTPWCFQSVRHLLERPRMLSLDTHSTRVSRFGTAMHPSFMSRNTRERCCLCLSTCSDSWEVTYQLPASPPPVGCSETRRVTCVTACLPKAARPGPFPHAQTRRQTVDHNRMNVTDTHRQQTNCVCSTLLVAVVAGGARACACAVLGLASVQVLALLRMHPSGCAGTDPSAGTVRSP